MIYIYCTILIAIYFALYFIFGHIFGRWVLKEEQPVAQQLLIGYFVYHLCFYLVCLPLKLTSRSLSLLTAVWTAVLIAALVAFLWLRVKRPEVPLCTKDADVPSLYRIGYGMGIFLLVSLMNVNMQTGALWDESHYVGEVTTSVYTDTLVGYDMYTGAKTKKVDEEYLLEITESHSAVMCRLFHLHPSVEVRTVRATVNVILFYLIVIGIGLLLFTEPIRSFLFFLFFVVLDLFSYNLHTRAQILIYRAFEGKAILANLILFMMLYLFLVNRQNPDAKRGWQMMFVVIAASFGLNMTSILLVPAMFGAWMLPFVIGKKRWGDIKRCVICLLPWIPETLFYLWLH